VSFAEDRHPGGEHGLFRTIIRARNPRRDLHSLDAGADQGCISSGRSPIGGIYRQPDPGCTSLDTWSFTLYGTLKVHDGAGQTVSAASSPAVHRA
jgi:hypothetical protein